MSTSNVRELAALRQREKKLRQRMAWTSGERRTAIIAELNALERRIAEMEEAS